MIYGIRPEDVRLDYEAGVAATVVAVEPTGYETHVLMKLGRKEIVAIMQRTRRLRAAGTRSVHSPARSPISSIRRPGSD